MTTTTAPRKKATTGRTTRSVATKRTTGQKAIAEHNAKQVKAMKAPAKASTTRKTSAKKMVDLTGQGSVTIKSKPLQGDRRSPVKDSAKPTRTTAKKTTAPATRAKPVRASATKPRASAKAAVKTKAAPKSRAAPAKKPVASRARRAS